MNFGLIFLFICLLYPYVKSTNICDPNPPTNEWPDGLVSENTKLITGIKEFKPVNATNLRQCANLCCENLNCNFAYYKEMQHCYLITCADDQSCIPVENERKSRTDQPDYLLQIRSVSESASFLEQLINKEKSDLSNLLENYNQKQKNTCSPDTNSCNKNELCLLVESKSVYECVCPKENNYHIIHGVCREYLPDTGNCELYVDECKLNEECLTKNERAKHGTCQCKLGFKRNTDTFNCEPELVQTTSTAKITNNRRRPALDSIDTTEKLVSNKQQDFDQDDESLWEKILEELGLRPTKPFNTTTTITTTTTTTTTTQAAKIFTKNLQAYAGPDQHVYYPSRMCILNGSLTSFLGNSPDKMIVKWEWIKDDSSPAFGHFVKTNKEPIVVFENLIEGDYKFILKVWTNDNQFSQDITHVYVHSSLNYVKEQNLINENIIQIDLDIKPNLFTEYSKEQFINKFESLLKQEKIDFKLNDPKIVLINTRIDTSKTSHVVLDLVITDLLSTNSSLSQTKQDSLNNQNLILTDKNRFIVNSSKLVKTLRKKHKKYNFESVKTMIQRIQNVNTIQNNQYSALDYLDIKIKSISQMTCFNDDLYSNSSLSLYNCSNHGKCDLYTRKCICDKYWMHNIFLYYLDYESDLTNGNNCEYNIPVVVLISTLVLIILFLILRIIFKYFLYYLFCCCLCCSKKNLKSEKKSNRYKSYRDDSYMKDSNDDLDDAETLISGERRKRTSSKKGFFDKLRNVPGTGVKSQAKYALLQADENDSLNSSKSSRGRFFEKSQNGKDIQLGAQLNYDDDEDVVYEENMVKKSDTNIKKYNII